MDEEHNETYIRLLVKGYANLLTRIGERGLAIIDPETQKNYVVYMTEEKVVIEETTDIENDCSFLIVIEEKDN